MARPLTKLEQQFVKEALAGYFGVLTPAEGYDPPIAMGAVHTGNLFSMEVIEEPDPGQPGSIYRLPDETSR